MDIRDRRPSGHLPGPDDFETPLTRQALTEANKRFKESGVPLAAGNDPVEAARRIRRATKGRFNLRVREGQDFGTVGDYLEYLNSEE
jgi:hypothetical protein